MQHTPGPWLHQPTAGNHDFLVYDEKTGRDVALVRDFDKANARLIAAAPGLLEALTNAAAILNAVINNHALGVEDIRDGLELALAAIAKAEGQ